MMSLILAGTFIFTPQGRIFVQPSGPDSYNIWSSNGLTQVRDFNGWQQIKQPDGTTTTIYPDPGNAPVAPVLPIEMGDGDGE